MDAAIDTATLIRYALTTLGIFALIFLLTLLTPWMAKKVDAWIARYRQNHSEEKKETYGVHSIYELPPKKTEKLSGIAQDVENEMLEEVSEEAWKEEKPIVPEVDWFEDSPPDNIGETKRLFPQHNSSQKVSSAPIEDTSNENEPEDDPLAMRKPAYDEPEPVEEPKQNVPQFMNICGILSGIQEPTYPPEGLEMVTSVFYEEPFPNAPAENTAPLMEKPKPEPPPMPEIPPQPEPIQPVKEKEHANQEEVNALLDKLIDKEQPQETIPFRHWEADPYDEEEEELDEEDFEYEDDIDDDYDDEDFDDEGWFRPAQ